LIGEGAFDGLLDPPRGVGRKLCAFGWVKAFHTFHQADIAFADQVQEGESQVFVVTGNLNHQLEVGLDHFFASFFVPFLNAKRELDLFGGRQQLHLSDFRQV
jgi:hypothetical protein